jgi:hypothetical protein
MGPENPPSGNFGWLMYRVQYLLYQVQNAWLAGERNGLRLFQ